MKRRQPMDRSLCLDAARQLEAAARRLRQMANPRRSDADVRQLLGEARALTHGALARFEHTNPAKEEEQ
jgi:hypothetical protein